MKLTRSPSVSIVILLILVCLTYCSDDNPVSRSSNPDSRISIPFAIGSEWTYEIQDNLTESFDTVVVSVDDTVTTSGGEFFAVLQLHRSGVISTRYVTAAGDTLKVFDDTLSLQPCEFIVFPLAVGNQWATPCGFADTNRVFRSGRISVPAGDFDGGFRIDRTWNIDFEGGGDRCSTWVVPKVGVAFRHLRSQFSDGTSTVFTADEIWQMLGYELTTPDVD